MKVIVDTSAWVRLFTRRSGNKVLLDLLSNDRVLVHPWVLGELALGGIMNNERQAQALFALPRSQVVSDDDLLSFVRDNDLDGHGIGWVDAQLLASAHQEQAGIHTYDRALERLCRPRAI